MAARLSSVAGESGAMIRITKLSSRTMRPVSRSRHWPRVSHVVSPSGKRGVTASATKRARCSSVMGPRPATSRPNSRSACSSRVPPACVQRASPEAVWGDVAQPGSSAATAMLSARLQPIRVA
ncbi:putative lipo domain protein [Burkholderia pseudomallei MSHR5596]|nr:putative lipo domain protein [Burkholderia pseudomallei MSHR5596]